MNQTTLRVWTKLLTPVTALLVAPLAAWGEPTVTLADKILTIDVPEAETYQLDSDYISKLKPALVTNVVKKGAGTLKWANQAKNYRGEIHIDEGTLDDASLYFLGNEPALTNVTLYIGADATWVVTRPSGGIDTYPKVDVAAGATLTFTPKNPASTAAACCMERRRSRAAVRSTRAFST